MKGLIKKITLVALLMGILAIVAGKENNENISYATQKEKIEGAILEWQNIEKESDSNECQKVLGADQELQILSDLNSDGAKERAIGVHFQCDTAIEYNLLLLDVNGEEYRPLGKVEGSIIYGYEPDGENEYQNILVTKYLTDNIAEIRDYGWSERFKKYYFNTIITVTQKEDGSLYQIKHRNQEKAIDVISLKPENHWGGTWNNNLFKKDIGGGPESEMLIKIEQGNSVTLYQILAQNRANGSWGNLYLEEEKPAAKSIALDDIYRESGRTYIMNHGIDSRSMTQYKLDGNILRYEEGVRAREIQGGSCEITSIDIKNRVFEEIQTKENCNIWTEELGQYFDLIGGKEEIMKRAEKATLALKNKNLEQFSELLHPEKEILINSGVVLSETLTKQDFQKYLSNNQEIINWGYYDAKPRQAKMSLREFLETNFLKDNYTENVEISFNSIKRGGSTSLNLLREKLEEKIPVSYYKKYTATYIDESSGEEVEISSSWKTLNLAFEKASDGKWYIVIMQIDHWSI